jgi:hypothetical protein
MSYSSPHAVREFLVSACLFVNHDFCLRCQRRTEKDRRKIIASTYEIDLCARIASLLGTSCSLAAQGRAARDLVNSAPVFDVEAKYLFNHRNPWEKVKGDWDWLLARSNTNRDFQKRAIIYFWPSTTLYTLTSCVTVPLGHGQQYSKNCFAPFLPYSEAEMPANGNYQRLRFNDIESQGPFGIQVPGGKRVRLDLVGARTHPIWCAVYTRMTPTEFNALPDIRQLNATDVPIAL